MAKIYFAGHGLDVVVPQGAVQLYETTVGAVGGISQGGCMVGGTESWGRCFMIDPATQLRTNVNTGVFSFHVDFYDAQYNHSNGGTSAGRLVELVKSGGQGLVRFHRDAGNTGNVRCSYWNGAAWVLMGAASISRNTVTHYQWDFVISGFAANSTISCYLNKGLAFQATGVDTSTWNIAYVDLFASTGQNDNSLATLYQQMIAADTNTIDYIIRKRSAPSGNSATNTAWINDYANVNEFPFNDTTTISGTAVSDFETYTATALSALTPGNEIKAVVIAARIRNDGGASPQNCRAAMRIGGVNYAASGDMQGINTGFQGSLNIFPTDPSTSANWTLANANSEFGLKATA